MMQPATTMVPPPMLPHQYQQQPPQQPSQPWMAQQPQQLPYQVHPSQPPPAAGYYYQQPQAPAGAVPQQQYVAGPAAQAQPIADDGIRSLWIGDLQYWMDEQYLYSCFGTTGEVVAVKVIRNKQTLQSEGYGFIEFVSHAAAERNLQTYNGSLMPSVEQTFRLNWASMGAGEKRDDASDYTIFVGDLAADVTDYMLQETFRANYPSVKGAKVVTDRITGRTKGYGFVRFGDESEQLRAMTEMNGRLCSTRPMRIGPAANKQKVGGQTQTKASLVSVLSFFVAFANGGWRQSEPYSPHTKLHRELQIFVGNLDPNITDDHLRQVFGQHGQLLHVKIPMGKRCGFVQFADRSCAEEALRVLNGTQLGGQSIRLSWGRSPSNKQVDPNQYSSGYYGCAPSYETYGYAPLPQDPNMYYANYTGYGSYSQPPQQQQQMQQPQALDSWAITGRRFPLKCSKGVERRELLLSSCSCSRDTISISCFSIYSHTRRRRFGAQTNDVDDFISDGD
ncbi:nuclear acid binding protein [Striga asiatica]|uniref:Nuclear acid binding protein n=1 Tax=Striga asiatica TaxID=4170 RepID=A0A5A7R9L9_STRAF|nr:nuclear acid binding protein [Striga asiatica]